LELARSIGRKSEENKKLRKEKEFAQQEIEHLKQQVDELSRLQHPREFKIVPPNTVPIDGDFMAHLGQLGVTAQSIGFDLMDRNENLDTMIERVIARWKVVVREARGGGGMAGQRSLSGDSSSALLPAPPSAGNSTSTPNNTNTNQTPTINMTLDQPQQPERTNSTATDNTMDAIGSDADADADADMEEDDSFVEMSDAPQPPTTNFRLANGTSTSNSNPNSGNGQQGGRITGMGEVVQGYVRIGA
jgi:hypothetical protein